MQLSSAQRWHSSERIAQRLLEEMGFTILEAHRKIVVNNVEVGEVDIIARDSEGNTYAVEVKAGKLDVTGLRQAYVNAILLGMKPLVVCKGFADNAARELADRLGVKVIQLSDVFLVENEELEIVVREAVEDAFSSFFELILEPPPALREDQKRIIETLAYTPSLHDAASRLDIPLETLLKSIDELRSRGVIPRWARRWSSIKRCAQVLTVKMQIYNQITSLQMLLEKLQQVLTAVSRLNNVLKQTLYIAERLNKALESIPLQSQSLESATSNDTASEPMQTAFQQGNAHHELSSS